MDAQLATLFVLTFAINLIGALAYAARIAGVRMRRIALAFSLFNAIVTISRTTNSFPAPLLAKRVEGNVLAGAITGALADFWWLLLAASLTTVVGALLTPTTQRLFSRASASSPDAVHSHGSSSPPSRYRILAPSARASLCPIPRT